MKKYEHLREKAVNLRVNGHSINDICAMLNKGKGTVWYWIRGVKIQKVNIFLANAKNRNKQAQIKAARATRKKFRQLHEQAKQRAKDRWLELQQNVDFRAFIMLYWCEGYKRTKHAVSVSNSNIVLLKLAKFWIEKFSNKKAVARLQIHADQNEPTIRSFWQNQLNISDVKIMRKSNSGKMKGRNWNSKYGVCTISIYDAYLKTEIDTWIDLLHQEIVDRV